MYLSGKVAIVTAGGGPGMGSAISKMLAKEGVTVVIAEIDPERGEKVAKEIQSSGGAAISMPTDVSNKANVQRMVDKTIKELGRIDILMNHAGVSLTGLVEDTSEEQFDRMVAVHLKGTFLCTQAVVPHMKERKSGRIVNMSSRNTNLPMIPGVATYAAVKSAISGFSRAMALELGPFGITVNCVAPGLTAGSGARPAVGEPKPQPTAEQNLKMLASERQVLEPNRWLRPEEVAAAVLHLVGPYTERVTGTMLHINGGCYFPP